jgi:hypothetical protein
MASLFPAGEVEALPGVRIIGAVIMGCKVLF